MQQNVSEGMVKHADEIFLEKTAVRTGTLLQLFLTHGITSALALAGVFVLTHLGISLPISIIGAIAISGGLGLLLTINIHYNVHLIERAVIAISEGRPATIPTFSWPLTQLFTHLHALIDVYKYMFRVSKRQRRYVDSICIRQVRPPREQNGNASPAIFTTRSSSNCSALV